MKHLKTLALAAVVAGALMAFIGVGTASATKLCSTTIATCPSGQNVQSGVTLDFSLASGTSASLQETQPPEGEGGVLDTCKSSTVKGHLTNVGSATETATGPIDELTWGTCTFPTTTTILGKLEVHNISGSSNGTLTADGETRVTINTIFFGTCVYTVPSGNSLGDLTEGKPAIFHANAVAHKVVGTPCPTTAVWTATYTWTEPKETTISVSTS